MADRYQLSNTNRSAFNENNGKRWNSTKFKQQQMRGKMGSTWDAKHMTSFLNQSNYSNWSEHGSNQGNRSHKRMFSTGDHFFKTTKDNKNVSKIGYTKINPLVGTSPMDPSRQPKITQIIRRQSPQRYSPPKHTMVEDGNFKFQSNSIKFRKTDPLTLSHTNPVNPTAYEKERLLNLIEKRHPHGMTGIDHPETNQPRYYEKMAETNRIRVQPNSHRTFLINREWKSKGRVDDSYKSEYGYSKGMITQQRRFRNDNIHGYNIVSNRWN